MSSVAKVDRSDSYGLRAVVLRHRIHCFRPGGGILVPAVLCCRSRSIEVVRIRTNTHALGPFGLSIIKEMLMA
jgi:hypothetical protein